MDWKIPLADLDYGPEEEAAVLAVLRSKWLTMGGVTQAFEEAFACSTGARYAFGVSSATTALHLACLALGIGPGDEVIVPSLTFVATANAVLYTGAVVRFADIIGPDDLTIDPASVEALITPRTKAIIPMHYAGTPCRMPELMALAKKFDVAVIEDAAHAPGASLATSDTLEGRALGTWGDAGCFSFFSNKNLATGEGGMLITSRADVADKVRLLRSHGMTTLTYDRHKGHAHSYDVVALGYNDRIDEIHSALGLAQLAKLPGNNLKRQALTAAYRAALAGSPIQVPFAEAHGQPAFHIMPVLLPGGVDREAVIDALKAEGIQTSIHYPPIHTFKYYRARFGEQSLPKTEEIAARELTLPLYPTMGVEAVRVVADWLIRAVESQLTGVR